MKLLHLATVFAGTMLMLPVTIIFLVKPRWSLEDLFTYYDPEMVAVVGAWVIGAGFVSLGIARDTKNSN